MKYKGGLFLIASILFFQCSGNKTLKVGIQPYETIEAVIIDSISNSLKKIYDVSVVVLPSKAIPETAFTNLKSPRYRADRLIEQLQNTKPDTLDYILGITNPDISITKKDIDGNIKKPEYKYSDWGIFGLGYKPGPSCIISTFRLKNSSRTIFIDRIKKISVHEFGHNLGLDHCDSERCVMRSAAESIRTIDFVRLELCTKCLKKIINIH